MASSSPELSGTQKDCTRREAARTARVGLLLQCGETVLGQLLRERIGEIDEVIEIDEAAMTSEVVVEEEIDVLVLVPSPGQEPDVSLAMESGRSVPIVVADYESETTDTERVWGDTSKVASIPVEVTQVGIYGLSAEVGATRMADIANTRAGVYRMSPAYQ